MPSIPIGFQLYSIRGECQKDLPGTLRAIAGIGYDGVEPWGYKGESLDWQGHSCGDIRRMLDHNALACCGLHLSPDALLGDRLQRTIEFNQVLGNRFLIIAGDKVRMSSRAGIAELATILNESAEKLRPHGMFVGYHAHAFDFVKVDGEFAWDILFGSTKSDVIMQLDIGNCASGGGDPIATLRKFPGRARSVHLKDYGGAEGSVLGEGKADWPEVFRLCKATQPVEWYVIEEEHDGFGFETARRSLHNLRMMRP